MMLDMIYGAWYVAWNDIWCLKWYMMLDIIYDAWYDAWYDIWCLK